MRGNLHSIGMTIVGGVHIGKMSAATLVTLLPTEAIMKSFVVGRRIGHKLVVEFVMMTTDAATTIKEMTGTLNVAVHLCSVDDMNRR